MNEELTPWFPKAISPARPGVYEVDAPTGTTYYSFFDGKRWNGEWWTPERAVTRGDPGYGMQGKQWRGLSEQPK